MPWRPPGNRTPTPQEIAICLPFILRQIELADPDVLVCLGGPSAQTLLGIKDGITKTRGRWFTFDTGTREIRAMPTFHPAFLLRSPLQKRFAWRDFLAIKKALAKLSRALASSMATSAGRCDQRDAEPVRRGKRSPRKITPNIATSTTDSLSIGATCQPRRA